MKDSPSGRRVFLREKESSELPHKEHQGIIKVDDCHNGLFVCSAFHISSVSFSISRIWEKILIKRFFFPADRALKIDDRTREEINSCVRASLGDFGGDGTTGDYT